MVWKLFVFTVLVSEAIAQFFIPPIHQGFPAPPPVPSPLIHHPPPFQPPFPSGTSVGVPGIFDSGSNFGSNSGSNLIGSSGGGGHNSHHPSPQTARSSAPAVSSVPARSSAPAVSSAPARSSAPAQTSSVQTRVTPVQTSSNVPTQRPNCLEQDFLLRCLQGTNQGLQACINECFANTRYNAEEKLKCEVNCYDLYYRRLSSCVTLEGNQ